MDVILLSEIEEKLNSVNTSLSNTLSTINTNVSSVKTDVSNVKTVCDNIYSKVDTEITSLLTNTNTNNTASTTGTLSQKLSSIINQTTAAKQQENAINFLKKSYNVISGTVSSTANTYTICNLSNIIVYELYAYVPYSRNSGSGSTWSQGSVICSYNGKSITLSSVGNGIFLSELGISSSSNTDLQGTLSNGVYFSSLNIQIKVDSSYGYGGNYRIVYKTI